MEKIICDFCEKNEAERYYRIEKLVEIAKFDFCTASRWIRKDICEECYNKLFKGDKNGIR